MQFQYRYTLNATKVVVPIAIMYDTMIGWFNSYHVWYDDWLVQ